MNLQDRLSGIGSSDAAPALGLSKWKPALQLYLEKVGEASPPEEETAAMRWGTLLEPAVRQEYAERTGRVVRMPAAMLRDERWPWMIGHPDGITEDGRLYEGKTARVSEGWGEPGSDQVPPAYCIQVQHLLVITKLEVADIAVLIGGQDFRMYEVPADPELQSLIIEGEAAFWRAVEAKKPPEPDFDSPFALEMVRKLFPGTSGQRLQASAQQAHWRAVYQEASDCEARYKAASDAAKAHLLAEMGEAAELAFQDGKTLRRKLVKRKAYAVSETEYMDARFVSAKE